MMRRIDPSLSKWILTNGGTKFTAEWGQKVTSAGYVEQAGE